MSQLIVHTKVYLAAGHHRQPRNADSTYEPEPPSVYPNATGINQTAAEQISFTLNGQQILANFLFWSWTDGVSGQTQTDPQLIQSVGAAGLTATAWYFPAGGPPGTATAIIDDAFSAAKGDFIDDTFVTVTSDPSLTSQANVVGEVPTAKAEVLKANASVPSTSEPFKKWMSFGAGTAAGDTLNVPAGATGLAFAVYERDPLPSLPSGRNVAIYGVPAAGVLVDAGGIVWVNGHPHPVDPWGPLLAHLVNLSTATDGAILAGGKFSAEVNKLAATEALSAIKAALPAVQRAAEAKLG